MALKALEKLREYPEGFLLDVYKGKPSDDPWGTWMYSFIVPCCPMCGRKLAGDA